VCGYLDALPEPQSESSERERIRIVRADTTSSRDWLRHSSWQDIRDALLSDQRYRRNLLIYKKLNILTPQKKGLYFVHQFERDRNL
jgi:hypothetical protein